ncbi:phage scaffolding protein [Ligaoa zhengdingensis]|uniref:phage scaffolding protein n=1 Tax=Ligaoa zhengdingensis TaxID=2763658 RepID=UPI002015F333|nr:phage scaffolding protein [Ligaoa zhengdingensis]
MSFLDGLEGGGDPDISRRGVRRRPEQGVKGSFVISILPTLPAFKYRARAALGSSASISQKHHRGRKESMEFLKSVFGDRALTYAELEAELKNNKEIKLGNLASGQYVDKGKYEALETRANGLQTQLDGANKAIGEFKKLDVEGIKKAAKDWEAKYTTETQALNAKLEQQKKDSRIDLALVEAKAKNVKAARALLDVDKVSLDGDNLIGLKDQLEAVAKANPFLFGEETGNPGPPVSGKTPGGMDDMSTWRAEAGLPTITSKE